MNIPNFRKIIHLLLIITLFLATTIVTSLGDIMNPASGQDSKPTIVLVHGAFAESSSWNGVLTQLIPKGYRKSP